MRAHRCESVFEGSRSLSLRRVWRVATCVLVLSGAGAAEAILWTSNGPVGGLVQALAVDPSDPATIFAGTSGGGFFRSTDAGSSWSAVNTGIASPGSFVMTGVSVSPLDPARVYGTGQSGAQGFVFRSSDGGVSWTSAQLDASANAVTAVGDPFRPNTVYCAGQALYRTLDGGETWHGVSFTGPYFSVVADPTAPLTVYAGGLSHVRKTTDGGSTWVSKSAGLPSGRDVQAIAVHPTTPSTLFAGVETSGVYRSTDGGDNWTSLGPTVGTSHLSVFALAIDPANPDTIHAAGIVSGGVGVYSSTNGGSSWTATPLALGAWALAVAPLSPTRLFAGTSEGAWASSNAGASWSAANTGLANRAIRSLATGTGGRVYAGGTTGKVFRSDNGGANWLPGVQVVVPDQIYSLAVDPSNPEIVYAGSMGLGGVRKSLDGGVSWSHLATGTAPITGYSLAVDPTNPSIVYAGAFGGVHRSTQGGLNWSPPNTFAPFVVALVIDPASPSTLYAGTDPIAAPFSGVYKTTNSGGLWTPVNTGLPSVAGTAVQALALDPVTGAVYAGLENLGVYKSTNAGGSWSAVNTGLANLDVTSLRVDPSPPSSVYAGTLGGGVYRSTDGGAQWVAIVDGLQNPHVMALAVTAPGRPLVGSGGNGVFFVPACSDDRDNDGDGAIDWDGGPAQGPPDPECTSPTRNRESPGACGLGAELVLVLGLIAALRRATSRSSSAERRSRSTARS